MVKESNQQPIKTEEIVVQVPQELRSGVYANTVNVTATNSEITLNFIFVHPTDDPKGTLVSRVVIPPSFADKLSGILQNVKKQIQSEESK